jgi:hypothetical protein
MPAIERSRGRLFNVCCRSVVGPQCVATLHNLVHEHTAQVQRQNVVVPDFAPHAGCRTVALRLMRFPERLIAFIEATLGSIDPRRP